MKPSFEKLKQELKMKNINLSHQRLKVLEYLTKNQCHPTVEQIFSDLQKEISTLSKTTVYNTLRMLLEAGLVRVVTIEDNETRYDIITENHGHFKCESCGAIYDFRIDMDSLICKDLNGFQANDKNVYFKGLCPRCLSKNKWLSFPPLSSFGNTLGTQDRRIKGAVFIPYKSNYANLSSLESTLNQLKFLDFVGWFTNEKGFQRGSHRIKKLLDHYRKSEMDMVICYSKEDLSGYESNLGSAEKSIEKSGIPIYCIKDCILIRNNEIVNLS